MPPLGLPVAFFAAMAMAAFEALRATLPASACEVRESQIDQLTFEMRYDAVKATLGCEGALAERTDLAPDLRMEVYRWRGDAWPYGVFSATFYNGVMHETNKTWLTFRIGASKPAPAENTVRVKLDRGS